MARPEDVLLELGDLTRLNVLFSLLERRKNVSQLVSELDMGQPRVSYHLKKLKEAGLASKERKGRWMWYGVNWETDDANIIELLSLLARWTGIENAEPTGLVPSCAAGDSGHEAQHGAGHDEDGAAHTTSAPDAGPVQDAVSQIAAIASRSKPKGPRAGGGGSHGTRNVVADPGVRAVDDEGRPIMEKPVQKTDDMEDFLL